MMRLHFCKFMYQSRHTNVLQAIALDIFKYFYSMTCVINVHVYKITKWIYLFEVNLSLCDLTWENIDKGDFQWRGNKTSAISYDLNKNKVVLMRCRPSWKFQFSISATLYKYDCQLVQVWMLQLKAN